RERRSPTRMLWRGFASGVAATARKKLRRQEKKKKHKVAVLGPGLGHLRKLQLLRRTSPSLPNLRIRITLCPEGRADAGSGVRTRKPRTNRHRLAIGCVTVLNLTSRNPRPL